MIPALAGLIATTGVIAGCAGSRGNTDPGPSAELTEVSRLMTGEFTNTDQASADHAFFDVRVHIVPIWRKRTDGHWFYVEQAMVAEPDHPYRQRIYFLHEPDPGRIVTAVYAIPDPEKWIGAWEDPGKFSDLKIEKLTERTGCDIILRRETDGVFSGGSEGTSCASDVLGAAYSTTQVRFTETGFDSWDRGFNASGAQVWGEASGPYRFVRITEEK